MKKILARADLESVGYEKEELKNDFQRQQGKLGKFHDHSILQESPLF